MYRSAVHAMPGRVERNYEDAVKLLNSRRRDVRPTFSPDAAAATTGVLSMPHASSFKGKPSLSGMKVWLRHLGHLDSDIDGLNIIHVAGTKGKGSTCAFVNSFLDAHRRRTGFPKRVGLYTSPHLKYVEDRIRINSKILSRDVFAQYVFEVWDSLKELDTDKPRILQTLILVAIHTFLREGVDVAICETHNGGEFDATNVFRQPVATGISTVGMDHIEQLGPSIENIASHKAGIFKAGSPAFSTLQDSLVAAVIQDRANQKGVELQYVGINPDLPDDAPSLKPLVQRLNASLALALTNALLAKRSSGSGKMSAEDIRNGVLQFSWPGRFQRIVQGSQEWFLDGAHNDLSVKIAANWFADVIGHDQSLATTVPRMMIFSHISVRDGAALLGCIANIFKSRNIRLQRLIISTYDQRLDGVNDTDRCFQAPDPALTASMKDSYLKIWHSIFPEIQAVFEPTIEGAINIVRQHGEANGAQTLITGSLNLMGGALRVLEPEV